MQLLQKNTSTTSNILFVYNPSQTYTSTVFEHLDAFRKYSKLSWFYLNIDDFNNNSEDLGKYQAVVLHYCVRLPFGQLGAEGVLSLSRFQGLKVLFIQDEYDNTNAVKKTICSIPFDLVFSVVPNNSIKKVYPPNEFPKTRFVSNLTGYVPDELIRQVGALVPPSNRSIVVAYRGRSLPVRYGQLGQEKIKIGQRVKDYCQKHGVRCDIEWDEISRIYGTDWYKFIASTKSMLGSESGSNVFDWNGNLQQVIDKYIKKWPNANTEEVYQNVIEPLEVDGLMNQVSPRIFEMAAAKTIMVLFEGAYSGVLEPGAHFLPLKKDFSNLKQVLNDLKDDARVDEMAERAYQDIILSGRYSYQNFVAMVDAEIQQMLLSTKRHPSDLSMPTLSRTTSCPVRSKPPLPVFTSPYAKAVGRLAIALWQHLPMGIRPYIKRMLGRT
jgi:hypothetical protein